MAHMLDFSTGAAAMAYTGEVPWHGLGERLEPGAPIERWLEAARLNWKVKTAPVLFQVPGLGGGKVARDNEHHVMFRDDTLQVLDVVGRVYTPHQNDEVLEFFREYLASGDMTLETAGAVRGGEYVWGAAQMNQGFELPGGDQVHGRILLLNPHQYGKGMIAKFCATRPVCWNTITAALGEGGGSIKVWHTKEFNAERRKEAARRLGIAKEQLEIMAEQADRLVSLTLEGDEPEQLLGKAFDLDLEEVGRSRAMVRVLSLFRGEGLGATLESSAGTGWGLLNGLTQYVDHEYGKTQDSRVVNAWLGNGEVQKRKLLGTLLAEHRERAGKGVDLVATAGVALAG